MNQDAINRIQRYVAAGIPPVVENLLGDAYAFIWDTSAPEDADFAIINRDGNFARAFQENGVWKLARNLGRSGSSPFAPERWEFTPITGPCLRECAQKMWLPSRGDEKLTFVPKELTKPNTGRQVICRNQLFRFRGIKDGGFKLELDGALSPEFQGKPWESEAAVDWCVARCRGPDAPKSAEAILQQAALAQSVVQAEVALDDIWGTF